MATSHELKVSSEMRAGSVPRENLAAQVNRTTILAPATALPHLGAPLVKGAGLVPTQLPLVAPVEHNPQAVRLRNAYVPVDEVHVAEAVSLMQNVEHQNILRLAVSETMEALEQIHTWERKQGQNTTTGKGFSGACCLISLVLYRLLIGLLEALIYLVSLIALAVLYVGLGLVLSFPLAFFYLIGGEDKNLGQRLFGSIDVFLVFVGAFFHFVQFGYSMHSKLDTVAMKLKNFNKSPDHMFVISRTDLLTLDHFPSYEEARHLCILKQIPLSELPVASRLTGSKVLFISHKWTGNVADHNDKVFLQVKALCQPLLPVAFDWSNYERTVAETLHMNMQIQKNQRINEKRKRQFKFVGTFEYVWFDFSCVPQQDNRLKVYYLGSIPQVVLRSVIFPVHPNAEIEKLYRASVWCQLEYMLLKGEKRDPVESQQFTIFCKDDLYQCLPGFLFLAVTRYRITFLRDRQGARTLYNILKVFVDHHDEKHGVIGGVRDSELVVGNADVESIV